MRLKAILFLLLATVFWGVSFPLIKAIGMTHANVLPGAGTWTITFASLMPRFTLGMLVVGALLRWRLGSFTRSEWKQGLGLGGFAAAGLIFQSDGLQFTLASTSAFLTQFYVVLIPLWVALRGRRNPGTSIWIAVIFVLAGVTVLADLNWSDLRLGRGEAETLLSSVFFAGQILWLERPQFRQNRALPITFAMFAVLAVVFAAPLPWLFANWSEPLALLGSGTWVACTVALTIFSTLGAFLLMNRWQPLVRASEAGIIYCAEPVFAALLALFLPGWISIWGGVGYSNERATAALLLGGALITAANLVAQLWPGAEHRKVDG
jgi:drug/metabolite transporter (DMT)-like permease